MAEYRVHVVINGRPTERVHTTRQAAQRDAERSPGPAMVSTNGRLVWRNRFRSFGI